MHTTRYWNNLHQVRSSQINVMDNRWANQELTIKRIKWYERQIIVKTILVSAICYQINLVLNFTVLEQRFVSLHEASITLTYFCLSPWICQHLKTAALLCFPDNWMYDDGYFRNTKLDLYIVITQLIVLKYLVNILIPAFLFSLSSI